MARAKKTRARSRVSVSTSTRVMVGVALFAAAAAAFGFLKIGPTAFVKTIVIRPSLSASSSPILLPNASNMPAGGFAFTGRGDAFVVDALTFTNCIALADLDGDCADSGETVGDSTGIQSATLQYTDRSGATLSSTAVPVGNTLSFTGLTLGVPSGASANIALFVTTANYSAAGVVSGAQVQYGLNAVSESFSGTSISRGVSITETDIRRNVVGTVMTERYSKPTVSLSSSSPSGTVSIPGVAGELLRFNVSADAAGDVNMTSGAFKVVVSDNDSTAWADCAAWGASGADIVNRSTGDSVLFTAYDTNGALCSAGHTVGYFTYTVPTSGRSADMGTISAGTTATYGVWTDFDLGIGSTDDVVQMSIPSESELDALGVSFDAFTWNDGVATSDANGAGVSTIPLAGNTLLFP